MIGTREHDVPLRSGGGLLKLEMGLRPIREISEKSPRAHVGGGMTRWWEFSPTPLVEESLDPFIRVSLPHAIGE